MKDLRTIIALLFVSSSFFSKGQTDTIALDKIGEFEYTWTYSAYTSIFDAQGNPYIYTASMELGLVVFDVSNASNPIPVDTILPAQLNNLKLTNISQYNNFIFGSLGSFQGVTQDAGLVIFDITDPTNVVIEDIWDSTTFSEGSAIAITDGQYAYLGAMTEGVVILDVSNVNNIIYVSDILPDQNFPEVPGPFSIPNARGMALKNSDTLILCNDAGGLRMIDVTDKFNPVEIGMYANTSIEATAQSAYNNVVIIGNYAYVPVDYCGLDIIDISSPVMTNVNWINPWNCTTTNWDGRPGHTNQIVNVGDSLLFLTGGDSEILVYDITDKANPVLVGEHVVPLNNEVSWGIDVSDQTVVIAMVDNPFGVPYDSDWGGIQIFEWNAEVLSLPENANENRLVIYPNPTTEQIYIQSESEFFEVIIYNSLGEISMQTFNSKNVDVSLLEPGVYFISVISEGLTNSEILVVY